MGVQGERAGIKHTIDEATENRLFILFFCRLHVCESKLVWSNGKNLSGAYKNIPKEMRPTCVHGPMHPPPSAQSV